MVNEHVLNKVFQVWYAFKLYYFEETGLGNELYMYVCHMYAGENYENVTFLAFLFRSGLPEDRTS